MPRSGPWPRGIGAVRRPACTRGVLTSFASMPSAGRRRRPQRTGEGSRMASGAATQPIKVFLVDDHEVVRRGVSALLEGEPDMRVVCEAGTAEQALARITAASPDVISEEHTSVLQSRANNV